MADRMIKSFCWKADGRILFKIESIYHHLEDDSRQELSGLKMESLR